MYDLSNEQRLKLSKVLMEYLNMGNWKGLFEQTDSEAFARQHTQFYEDDDWGNDSLDQDCIDAVAHILAKDSENLKVIWKIDGVATIASRKDEGLHREIEALLGGANDDSAEVVANPDEAETFEAMKQEVLITYMKYYVEGFKLNDISLIDKIVKYPIAYIKDGSVTMCDSYPINPQQLKDEKQWDHSIEWKFEVTAVNEKDAHAVASAIRCRKDGSKIESVHGFYAFTKTSEGWKMYAVADTTF